jgi:hypothetical protein
MTKIRWFCCLLCGAIILGFAHIGLGICLFGVGFLITPDVAD